MNSRWASTITNTKGTVTGSPWNRPTTCCLPTTGNRTSSGRLTTPIQSRLTPSYLGIYGTDSWTIARRLTLNLGLRYARKDVSIPAQCLEGVAPPSNVAFPDQCFPRVEVPVFNSVAPRLHFAYDLTGDGKTVLKGGWGRFDYIRTNEPDIERLNRNTDAIAIYDWHDLNGNNDYDAGEVNLDPNGPDFVETVGNELDDPAPRAVPNPNEKQPKSDEFSLSIERELVSNFAVKVTGIHSRYKNIRREQNNLRPYGSLTFRSRIATRAPTARLAPATMAACSRTMSIRRT